MRFRVHRTSNCDGERKNFEEGQRKETAAKKAKVDLRPFVRRPEPEVDTQPQASYPLTPTSNNAPTSTR